MNSQAYLMTSNDLGVCVVKSSSSNSVIDILKVKNNENFQIIAQENIADSKNNACNVLLKETFHKYNTDTTVEYYQQNKLNNIILAGNIKIAGKYKFPDHYEIKQFIDYIKYKSNNINKKVDFSINRNGLILKPQSIDNNKVYDNDIIIINKFYIDNKNNSHPQTIKPKIDIKAKKPQKNQVTTKNTTDIENKNAFVNSQLIAEKNKQEQAPQKQQQTNKKHIPIIQPAKIVAPNEHQMQIIMPGDIMEINLPGEKLFNRNFLVDRNGEINLPEVGAVTVKNLTIEEAITKIFDKLSTVFLGVGKLSIKLKEKRVLIKILGYVEKPGEVDLPTDANIQVAINAVGGFKIGARLSKIQLLRNNKKTDINFKKYLETGDEAYLPKLKTLDILFVPSSPEISDIYGENVTRKEIDPTQDKFAIKVIGEVINPGSLSYKDNMTAVDALLLAGGVTRYADDENIRVINSGNPVLFSLAEYMKYGNKINSIKLDKGATIYVPIKADKTVIEDPTENPESIKIFGEVLKPGVQKYKKNISLVDLLLLSGGVTRYANVEQIRLIAHGEPVLFNLKSYLDSGTILPKIEPGSTIFIPKQVEAISSGESVIYIMGQVHKPGSYETGKDVNFMDVLANAGGPDRFADTRSIRVLRKSGEVLKFNLDEYSEGLITEMPAVNKGDSILVPRKTGDDQGWLKFTSDQTIKIIGSVKSPGRYPWSNTIDFMDLLAHAGGTGEKADIAHIKLIYTSKNGDTKREVFNLQGFLEDGGKQLKLPELEGGLTIMVPELPTSPTDNKSQWVLLAKEQAIYILGAVNSPGRYAFNERLDLMDILTAADGPKDDADLSNITVVHRSDGKEKISTLNLIEYFDTGNESLLPVVKPSDSIYVHSRDATTMGKEQTITVLGEVNKTGRFVYRSGITLIDVLSEAGGTTTTADLEKIIIKRSKHQQIIFDLQEYMDNPDEIQAPELNRGDTIFVTDNSSSFVSIIRSFLKDLTGILPLIILFSGKGGG